MLSHHADFRFGMKKPLARLVRLIIPGCHPRPLVCSGKRTLRQPRINVKCSKPADLCELCGIHGAVMPFFVGIKHVFSGHLWRHSGAVPSF
jgi:hypothetical protein